MEGDTAAIDSYQVQPEEDFGSRHDLLHEFLLRHQAGYEISEARPTLSHLHIESLLPTILRIESLKFITTY